MKSHPTRLFAFHGVALALLLAGPALAQTLNPTADTYVRSGVNQDTNYSTLATLEIKKSANPADDFNREIYLKFDLSSVTSIQNAKLRLYGSAGSPEIVTTDIYSCSNTSWSETGITWANKPATGPGMWATLALQNTPAWHEWDVTQYLQGEKTMGRNIVTLVLKNSVASTTGTIAFNSRENASNKPQLVITAAFPWTYYEAEAGTKHASATLNTGVNWGDIAFEARGKKTVTLDASGEWVQWTNVKAASHVTMRYSIADGATGTLALYVGGVKKADLALNSLRMRETKTTAGPPGNIVRFFDDVMVAVPGGIPANSTVKLQKDVSGTTAYVIDFMEVETAPAALTKPDSSWLDITTYGAIANDGGNDRAAIEACIAAANSGSKKVWIPAGTFDISSNGGATTGNGIVVPASIQIRGAGIWHTRLNKNYTGQNARLFTLGNSNVMQDFKVVGVMSTLDGNGGNCVFRNDTTGTTIERIWTEYTPLAVAYNCTNGIYRSNRIRNTYKDSIHVARASVNNLLEKNAVRNAGDDNIALVSYDTAGMSGNTIRLNVAECGYWGRGLTNIGGDGNRIELNLINDCVKAGVAAVVESYSGLNTPYCTNWVIEKNVIVRCGSQVSGPLNSAVGIYGGIDTPLAGRMESNAILAPPFHGARVQGYVGDSGAANAVYYRYNAVEAPVAGGTWLRKSVSLQPGSNLVDTPNTDL
jgi:hypothetical protein